MSGRWNSLLRGQDGVGDLKSVIVGVLATMFIMAASVLSVQAMVPWQQDRNAKAALAAIAPAQQAAMNASGSFASLEDLVEAKWLEHKPTGVSVAMPADEACWSAVAVSLSGKVLLDEGQGPVTLGDSTYTSSCLSTTEIRSLVQQAGGPSSWNKVIGILAPPAHLTYDKDTRAITWDAVTGAAGYQVSARCGSSLSDAPFHKAFVTASTRTSTLGTGGCSEGMPMLINVWTAGSDGGTPTGRVAGLAVNR